MNEKCLIPPIILMFLLVGLSGCNESSNGLEENKFLGRWISEHIIHNITIIFTSDGKYDSFDYIWGVGTYEVKDGGLTLHMANSNVVFTIDYKFSNSDETFTLLFESGETLLFTKQ